MGDPFQEAIRRVEAREHSQAERAEAERLAQESRVKVIRDLVADFIARADGSGLSWIDVDGVEHRTSRIRRRKSSVSVKRRIEFWPVQPGNQVYVLASGQLARTFHPGEGLADALMSDAQIAALDPERFAEALATALRSIGKL
jgi:hypothetical protein